MLSNFGQAIITRIALTVLFIAVSLSSEAQKGGVKTLGDVDCGCLGEASVMMPTVIVACGTSIHQIVICRAGEFEHIEFVTRFPEITGTFFQAESNEVFEYQPIHDFEARTTRHVIELGDEELLPPNISIDFTAQTCYDCDNIDGICTPIPPPSVLEIVSATGVIRGGTTTTVGARSGTIFGSGGTTFRFLRGRVFYSDGNTTFPDVDVRVTRIDSFPVNLSGRSGNDGTYAVFFGGAVIGDVFNAFELDAAAVDPNSCVAMTATNLSYDGRNDVIQNFVLSVDPPPPTSTPTITNTPTVTQTPTVTETPTDTIPPTPTPTITNTPAPTFLNDRSDINGDGGVNSNDLLILLNDWRKETGPSIRR